MAIDAPHVPPSGIRPPVSSEDIAAFTSGRGCSLPSLSRYTASFGSLMGLAPLTLDMDAAESIAKICGPSSPGVLGGYILWNCMLIMETSNIRSTSLWEINLFILFRDSASLPDRSPSLLPSHSAVS